VLAPIFFVTISGFLLCANILFTVICDTDRYVAASTILSQESFKQKSSSRVTSMLNL